MTWTSALGWFFAAYALLTGIFIVLENRRPQATMAWMLLFLGLPGLGLAIYVLFGRDRKAFSREITIGVGRRAVRGRNMRRSPGGTRCTAGPRLFIAPPL